MASRALIIANSVYDDEQFSALPAAAADAQHLAAVLGDPEIGGFEVESLVDVGQRAAMRSLESFFTRAGRDDLLLVHLSLHGWKDIRNRLHFVMRDTERDYPGSTAVAADTLSTFMNESRCRRIVVLLDCCYSGAFTLNAQRRDPAPPAVDVAEPFAGNGRVVITASTSLQYAHEGELDVRYSRTPAQPSVFTSAVVRGLRDGAADLDGDGLISVEELYDFVHEQVRQQIAGQTPTLSVDSAQGTIYVARSPRHADTDRLTEMRLGVNDAQPWKRVGSLHLVAQLLGSVREATRDAAEAALLGLIADADREVANRARQLWHERGLGEIPTVRRPRPEPPAPGPQRLGPAVGIDFGTTNSSIAILEGDDVRIVPNAEGSLTTPSLLAITANGDLLIGAAAKRQALQNAEFTVRSVKLRLGTDWSITRGDVRLTAEDIAELILRRLREDAEAYAGQPPRQAVVTVPANFDLAQRAALVETARRAGLNVQRVLNEPTAAALTYGLGRLTDARALIFDLGGGTLDVSLVEVGDGVVEVKATSGDRQLGGDDWDQRLAEHLIGRVRDAYGVDLSQDALARQRFQDAAEMAKIELSSATSTVVRLPFLTSTPAGPVHFEQVVTRVEFERMTNDLLERCRGPIEQALQDAGMHPSMIDQVILTGGATRMPAIGDLVRQATGGQHPYRGLIPDGIVTGAALQAGVLEGAIKDTLLLDVVSAPLGVDTSDGSVLTLIARGTTIPTRSWAYAGPSAGEQTAMTLRVLEGEFAAADRNKTLALLELSDLPRHPIGTPLIEVEFDVDANSTLHVRARELRGTTAQIVDRAHALHELRTAMLRVGYRDASHRRQLEAELTALESDSFTARTWQTIVDRVSMSRAAARLASVDRARLRSHTPILSKAPGPRGHGAK
ncbi:Hsp70 family protein [Kribbella sp. NPDC051587]|uniref:caspase, EACC1-associated type n=1 Tax=Kribbella sp. NPDC051587 TaxID=3364119 RepID=UPI003793F284